MSKTTLRHPLHYDYHPFPHNVKPTLLVIPVVDSPSLTLSTCPFVIETYGTVKFNVSESKNKKKLNVAF